MFSIRRPAEEKIAALRSSAAPQQLTYPFEGFTRSDDPEQAVPPGYQLDRHQVVLGHGEETFQRAAEAIRQWRMFPTEVAELYDRQTPIDVAEVVAVLFHGYGLWTLNPARIIYTIDERELDWRFGFAYGTLPGHLARGEELFLVERSGETDEVTFSIVAVSRPSHLFSWIGYPLVRREQRRFRRLSGEAMQAAVTSDQD